MTERRSITRILVSGTEEVQCVCRPVLSAAVPVILNIPHGASKRSEALGQSESACITGPLLLRSKAQWFDSGRDRTHTPTG